MAVNKLFEIDKVIKYSNKRIQAYVDEKYMNAKEYIDDENEELYSLTNDCLDNYISYAEDNDKSFLLEYNTNVDDLFNYVTGMNMSKINNVVFDDKDKEVIKALIGGENEVYSDFMADLIVYYENLKIYSLKQRLEIANNFLADKDITNLLKEATKENSFDDYVYTYRDFMECANSELKKKTINKDKLDILNDLNEVFDIAITNAKEDCEVPINYNSEWIDVADAVYEENGKFYQDLQDIVDTIDFTNSEIIQCEFSPAYKEKLEILENVKGKQL